MTAPRPSVKPSAHLEADQIDDLMKWTIKDGEWVRRLFTLTHSPAGLSDRRAEGMTK